MPSSSTKIGFFSGNVSENGQETRYRDGPIISRSMIQRFLQTHFEKDQPDLFQSRGYVQSGKEISAEEMDRRTMDILDQW
ncbi:MAG: hypothetical protein HQL76_08925 [Magnetococcales bacterium]|nr:hypothetical protein [Magnetococcales bacterium]